MILLDAIVLKTKNKIDSEKQRCEKRRNIPSDSLTFKSNHKVSNIRNLSNRKYLVRRQFKNQNPVDHIQSLQKFAGQERSFIQSQNKVQRIYHYLFLLKLLRYSFTHY